MQNSKYRKYGLKRGKRILYNSVVVGIKTILNATYRNKI